MISLHLCVALATLCGMKFLFGQGSSSPAWFEVLQSYDFCHHHVQVTSNGVCWMDGVAVDCVQAGLSDVARTMLRYIQPAIEIFSLLAFFTCIVTHLFYKAYDKGWCSSKELQQYRLWIMFSIALAVMAGVASTAMSVTFALLTVSNEEISCTHALKSGWARVLIVLLTGVLIGLANGFARESAEMVYESRVTISEEKNEVQDEEKHILLVTEIDEQA